MDSWLSIINDFENKVNPIYLHRRMGFLMRVILFLQSNQLAFKTVANVRCMRPFFRNGVPIICFLFASSDASTVPGPWWNKCNNHRSCISLVPGYSG